MVIVIELEFSCAYFFPVFQFDGFIFSLKTIYAQHFFCQSKQSFCASIGADLSYEEIQRVFRIFFPESIRSLICVMCVDFSIDLVVFEGLAMIKTCLKHAIDKMRD